MPNATKSQSFSSDRKLQSSAEGLFSARFQDKIPIEIFRLEGILVLLSSSAMLVETVFDEFVEIDGELTIGIFSSTEDELPTTEMMTAKVAISHDIR